MSGSTVPSTTASVSGIARASLLQKLGGYVSTQLIYLLAQCGIPDLLIDGPQSVTSLAADLGMKHVPLHRFLRGCVTAGLLIEVEPDYFAATPLTQLLESTRPDSLRDYAILTGELWYPTWGHLSAALYTGSNAFEMVFGTTYYSYLAQASVHGCRFQSFMQTRTLQSAQALTMIYDFSAATVVVDVGGGNGTLLLQVLAANLHLRGILYDRPEVIAEAEQRAELQSLAARCCYIGGDFLQQVPEGGDCYILSQILHNWNDEQCQQILHNCFARMQRGSRLLIVEQLLPERLQGTSPAIESDLMMLLFLGGQERTQTNYERLLNRAGFSLITIHSLKCLGYSLIEAQSQA